MLVDIRMTKNSYQHTLDADGHFTDESVAWVEAKLGLNPHDYRLWDMRGNFIQLSNTEPSKYTLEDSKASYLKAIAINPDFAQGHESLGYYYDVIEEDYHSSVLHFRKALALEKRLNCYIGLARVLAQTGHKQEALLLLSPESCPHAEDMDVQIMRQEIEAGMWAPS